MGVAAAWGAVGLSACSSPSTPGTTTSAAGSATTGPTATSSTSTSVSPGLACAAKDLVATVAGSQGAAGTFEVTFALRNNSTTACPTNGFPGLQLLDASGAHLTTHVVRGGSYPFTNLAPAPVILLGGSTAYFNMAYSDVPTGTETTCPTAARIEVTPPNAVDHDVVPVQLAVCGGGTLTVSPVFNATSPGAQTTAPPQA